MISSYNTVVVGNQLWNNQGTGIRMEGTTSGARIFFNTIVLDSVGVLLVDSCSNVEIANNLMALNGSYGLETLTSGSWSEHHNLFFDNGGDGNTGANAIKAGDPTSPHPSDVLDDPRLVDPYNGDLTPQAEAIDSAIDLGYDRNGPTPGLFNGQAPDIGAVETP